MTQNSNLRMTDAEMRVYAATKMQEMLASAEADRNRLAAENARLREAIDECKRAAYALPGGVWKLPDTILRITRAALGEEGE